MGLWVKGIKRSKAGLSVKDGILVKCPVKEGTFTVPDDMTAVAKDAFEGCENVKINYSEKYIQSELTGLISTTLKSLEREFKVHPRVVEFGDPNPLLKVWNMAACNVESAINAAVAKRKKENPEIKWNITTIDADKIADICREIERIGRDNLIKIDGDKVSTLFDIPFLMSSPVRQLGAYSDYVNDLMDKEGYGILYVKNLNSENINSLPNNFVYNLIKSHSFHHVRLSSKWEVVFEIGEGVGFEASLQDIGWIFNGNSYKGLTPERFLKEMEWQHRVVNTEPKTSESEEIEDKTENDVLEDKQDTKSQMENISETGKEIDWEERHFQICLSLLSRTELYNGHTSSVVPIKIIKKADEMVEALKKHHEEKK